MIEKIERSPVASKVSLVFQKFLHALQFLSKAYRQFCSKGRSQL